MDATTETTAIPGAPVLERPDSDFHVLVGVPSDDRVSASFAYDLARMMGWTTGAFPRMRISLLFSRHTLLPYSRQKIAEYALEIGATHILWLDSDMRFPIDTIARMVSRMETEKISVLAANYSTRRQPCIPTAYSRERGLLLPDPALTGTEIVDRAGMGVMMTAIEVFKALKMPWFVFGWAQESMAHVGEDVFFCRAAAKAGFDVYLDLDLSNDVKHCGEMEYHITHTLATAHAIDEARAKAAALLDQKADDAATDSRRILSLHE